MKPDDLKKAYPSLPDSHREAIHQAARTAIATDRKRMPRRRLVLVWAVIAVLLVGTAAALMERFGMWELFRGQLSPEAQARIVNIDKAYETTDFSLYITDALSDGAYLYVNMDLQPKAGGQPVYIRPRFEATQKGQPLLVDLEEMAPYAVNGFWLPPRAGTEDAHANLPHYPFGLAVYNDGGYQPMDTTTDLQGTDEAITWTMKLHVLKPNWPVTEDHSKTPDPKYMAAFRKAYEAQRILLAYGFALEEYASVSIPAGMDQQAYYDLPMEEKLVASGAFRLAETIVSNFTTQGTRRHRAAPQTLQLPGMAVEIKKLEASFYSTQFDLRLEVQDKGLAALLGQPNSQVEISLDGNPPGLYSLVHPQPQEPGSFSLAGSLTDAASPGIPSKVRLRLLKEGTADVQDISKRQYDEGLDLEVVLE